MLGSALLSPAVVWRVRHCQLPAHARDFTIPAAAAACLQEVNMAAARQGVSSLIALMIKAKKSSAAPSAHSPILAGSATTCVVVAGPTAPALPAQPKAVSMTHVTITTNPTTTAVDRRSSNSTTNAMAVQPVTLSTLDFPLLTSSVAHVKGGSGSSSGNASTRRSSLCGPVAAAPQWVAVVNPRNLLTTPGVADSLPAKDSSTAWAYSRVNNSTHATSGAQGFRNSLSAPKSVARGRSSSGSVGSGGNSSLGSCYIRVNQHGAFAANSGARIDHSSKVCQGKGRNKNKRPNKSGSGDSPGTTAPMGSALRELRSPGSSAASSAW